MQLNLIVQAAHLAPIETAYDSVPDQTFSGSKPDQEHTESPIAIVQLLPCPPFTLGLYDDGVRNLKRAAQADNVAFLETEE